MPGNTYKFVRPAQRGKSTYVFEPPACLAATGRKLSDEDAQGRREQMAKQFAGTRLASVLENKPTQLEIRLAPLAAISSYRSFVGAIVRVKDSSSCRLDIWDLTSERLAFVEPLSTCPTTFWFTDDTLSLVQDLHLSEVSFRRSLYDVEA